MFTSFDICDFYPSITNKLLEKSLTFASQFSNISVEDRRIIKYTKKTTLFKDGTQWTKKSSDFDITMGSFDGAEVCELVELYLLSQLQRLDMNVELYRDDGLAVAKLPPQNTERMKKEICKIFKQNNLNITIEANKKPSTSWTSPSIYELGSINPIENPTAVSTIYIKIVTTHHQL